MHPTRTLYWRALALALALGACGHAAGPTHLQTASAGSVRLAELTTTTAPPPPPTTTTLPAPPRPGPKVARVGPRTTVPPAVHTTPLARQPGWWPDTAFWQRLSLGCESSTGDNGNGGGYFQFSPGTAKAVGYHPGMTWDQQRALADNWLARIGGPARGGTTSGWPHCWWVALRG